MKKIILLLVVIVVAASAGFAGNKEKDKPAVADTSAVSREIQRLDSIVESIQTETGKVVIGSNIAEINVPDGFVFLNPKEAAKVLSGLWHNPPSDDLLGLLMQKGVNPMNDSSWAIVYTYEESGHVKDDDAKDINYDELLTKMKSESDEVNKDRVLKGYEEIHIINWAEKPYYDQANHKLHWAKELKFGTDSANTLNYNIRMLGRRGVLVMNGVASMANLNHVEANLDKIMTSTNFTKGNTYNDFDGSSDKVAEYGIGGLIAGGVLLKTGLLAKLGLVLVKVWKLLFAGAAAVIAFLRKKVFTKKDYSRM